MIRYCDVYQFQSVREKKANMISIGNLLLITQYYLKCATSLVVTFGNSYAMVGNCTRKESVYLPWISRSSRSNYLDGDKRVETKGKSVRTQNFNDDK